MPLSFLFLITAYVHSCETTLLSLTEKWKMAADSKQYVGILSTDMTKACDSLHPALMVNKFKAYGFWEEVLCLIRSYFTNRQNRVKLDSVMSYWRDTIRGCPQGSSFGPLMWNIFQNDLTLLINSSPSNLNLSMYADDHQLFVAGNSIQEVEQSLNEGGQGISRWYTDNFLMRNHDKYNTMLIGRKNNDEQSISVDIDGENITSVPALKLLGVTISPHISAIRKKASRKVNALVRLKRMIPTEAKLQFFKSAILPDLSYCHIVWHFCKPSETRKLENVQERALCAVLSIENYWRRGVCLVWKIGVFKTFWY